MKGKTYDYYNMQEAPPNIYLKGVEMYEKNIVIFSQYKMFIGPTKQVYNRQKYGILEVTGQVGGSLNIAMLLIAAFMGSYSAINYNSAIISKIYRF